MMTRASLLAVLASLTPSLAPAQVSGGEVLVNYLTGGMRHYLPDGSIAAEAFGNAWHGAAIDAAGHWLTVRRLGRLLVRDVDGSPLQSIDVLEVTSTNGDVSVFADGTFAICDMNSNQVEFYASDGTHLMVLSPAGMDRPTGSLVDSEDTLWVCDFDGRQMWRFSRSGTVLDTFPIAGNAKPGDVDEASDGTLWVTLYHQATVQQYAKDGTLLGSFPVALDNYSMGLAVGVDDTIWVCAYGGNQMYQYSTTGTQLASFPIGPNSWYIVSPKVSLGSLYCSPALPTSTGLPARIGAEGSLRVSENDLTLIAEDLPPGEFGYFFGGETQGMAMPFGSDGIICLAGVIARFSQPQQIVQGPTAAIPIDLTSIPTSPPVAVAPGDTWNFQCWFRDGVSSNFTDALSITFQ